MSEVRIGIIGAGWWAVKNHIPVLQSRKDVNITSICGLGRKEVRQIQEQFGIPFGTEDYRELLKHGDLDGVIICSPIGFTTSMRWLRWKRAFMCCARSPWY